MYASSLFIILFLSFSLYAEEECQIPGNPFTEVENLIRGVRNNCEELAPGNFRLTKTESGRGQFLMERDATGNYRATFNVNYVPLRRVAADPAALARKVNECLAIVSPYLRGPDGNSLTLRVLSEEQTAQLPRPQRPRARTISVGAVGSRSNNTMFSIDDDCGTITHEFLHNVGLQDEYPETSEELRDTWACRPITRTDSVMYYHWEALNAAVPRTVSCECASPACETLRSTPDPEISRRLVRQSQWPMTPDFMNRYCTNRFTHAPATATYQDGLHGLLENGESFTVNFNSYWPNNTTNRFDLMNNELVCRCTTPDCVSKKAEFLPRIGQAAPNRDSCPQGMREVSKAWDRGTYPSGFSGNNFRFSTTPTRPSILFPNQFRRAIAGTCEDNVPGYGMCGGYAYRGRRAGVCETPAECSRPDFYLGAMAQ